MYDFSNKRKHKQARKKAGNYISRADVREQIFNRDGHRCLKCGSKEHLTLDHIVSVYLGGENTIGNLQTLCRSCNSAKSPDRIIDYRAVK